MHYLLDKPSYMSYTVYMMRVKDGWSTVKFPKRGVEVRVSHILSGKAERVLESIGLGCSVTTVSLSPHIGEH